MMANKVLTETDEQSRIRFQVELEFVQCLANPNYIHFLAQRGYLKEQTFVNYLKYLQYWREPKYARYLKYPMCLHFLELLQHEAFRRECVSAQVCKFMDDQAILLWQHYTRRRTRTLQPPDAPAPPAPRRRPHKEPLDNSLDNKPKYNYRNRNNLNINIKRQIRRRL